LHRRNLMWLTLRRSLKGCEWLGVSQA